jgi:hypothetical protein
MFGRAQCPGITYPEVVTKADQAHRCTASDDRTVA